MRKKVYFLVIMSVLALGWMCTSYAASNDVSVMVNGKYVDFSGGYGQPFISDENRTLVPVRGTAEAYGCNVSWDQTKKEVTITYQGHTARIPVDQPYVYTDSGTKVMDTSARIIDGRTYLPIRFAMEAMGAKVSWDNDNHIVIIENPTYVNPLRTLKNGLMSYGEYDSDLGYVYGDKFIESEELVTALIYEPNENRVHITMYMPDSKGGTSFFIVYFDESNYNPEPYYCGIEESSGEIMKWSGKVDKNHYGELSAYVINDTNITYDLRQDTLLKLTRTQTEIAVLALDEFCDRYNLGISSADFGFHK